MLDTFKHATETPDQKEGDKQPGSESALGSEKKPEANDDEYERV